MCVEVRASWAPAHVANIIQRDWITGCSSILMLSSAPYAHLLSSFIPSFLGFSSSVNKSFLQRSFPASQSTLWPWRIVPQIDNATNVEIFLKIMKHHIIFSLLEGQMTCMLLFMPVNESHAPSLIYPHIAGPLDPQETPLHQNKLRLCSCLDYKNLHYFS